MLPTVLTVKLRSGRATEDIYYLDYLKSIRLAKMEQHYPGHFEAFAPRLNQATPCQRFESTASPSIKS